MRIFLSWSGRRSYEVANALRDWLPEVLQAVDPWLSSDDIQAGARWQDEIIKALSSSEFLIVCVTSENSRSAFLHFEVGFASKETRTVVPFLLDVKPQDLTGPMAQFHATVAERDDVRRLVVSINDRLARRLSRQTLDRVFDRSWPRLAEALAAIRRTPSLASPPTASDNEAALASEVQKLMQVVSELVGRIDLGFIPAPVVQPEVGATPAVRPTVFIGSSSEGLRIAEAIQANLDQDAETTVWNQGPFEPSKTTIESLVELAAAYDFAIIVLTPDDMILKRGETSPAPRDNLIFELGLFTGRLGRARTFMILPRDHKIELPSDLKGVTAVTYGDRSDRNLLAAMGPVSLRIRQAMGLP